MKVVACIFVGAGIGGVVRYLAQSAAARWWPDLPVGTFIVNLLGCFCMGLLLAAWAKQAPSDWARGLLGVGILGGFTTFSAFSGETLLLIQRGSTGTALLYALASSVGCISMCALGYAVLSKVSS